MDLKFHHIGIACSNIEETAIFLENTFDIEDKTEIFTLSNQGVDVCLLTCKDRLNIELVSGKTVERFVKKRQYLYHNCWEVEDIYLAIDHFIKNGSLAS
jgi:methylmalonyl-CoA/ethylmalonyl-CoA epimerase